MYRDLALTPTDAEAIARHQLRYDITIIPPLYMGLELVKTCGHYHPRVNPKLRYTYLEYTRYSTGMHTTCCSAH